LKIFYSTKEHSSLEHQQIRPVLAIIQPILFKYRKRIALGFAALVGVDLLQLVIPRLLKIAVDGLATDTATGQTLLRVSGLILIAAVGAGLLRFCWRYLIIGFSRMLERDIRNRIYSHVLKMDQSFYEKRTTGDIMAHVSNDLQAVQMACGIGLVSAVDAFVMSVAAISFMLYIHPQLTMLALLPMPFLAICTRILTGRLHHRFNAVQEQFSLMTEFVRSTLVSIRLVKAYTMESLQKKEFGHLGEEYVRSNIRVAIIHGLLFPVAALVGNLGMLLVLYFGGKLAIEGKITLGDFVAFVTYLYMLVWPMMAIGWVANLAQRGLTSLKRIHNLVTSEPQVIDRLGDQDEHIEIPSFRIHNLTFSYQSANHPALDGVNMELKEGIYGITGRTGSGKTTLCKLLARLYPVADGCLYFDDKDVNTLALDTVRSQIAYVGQEAVLFSDTVAANISYGRPGATSAEVESAARQAAIHNEILDFSKGYDTVIGERGVTLSGGQRQRLALARALITDRPILIIDDALAALDVETEHVVLQSIVNLQKRKIVLIVSQRVKLLSETDKIFVLHKGRLQDMGTHSELLLRNDLYKTMSEKQARESNNVHPGSVEG
jgi:ATP-binding cassette subfamily B protein